MTLLRRPGAASVPARRPTRRPGPGTRAALGLALTAGSALLALPPLPALAAGPTVYRCEVGGRVVYQQSACRADESGQRVGVSPTNQASAPPRPAAAPTPPAPVQTAPALATVPAAAPAMLCNA